MEFITEAEKNVEKIEQMRISMKLFKEELMEMIETYIDPWL